MDHASFFAMLRRTPWTGVQLEAWLAGASILLVRWIERALREPRHEGLRTGVELRVDSLPAQVGLLGIASCQRDGHQRQAALDALVHHPGRWALGFLANRLNDPVPAIRVVARAHVEHRVRTAPPDELVACLPLLDGSIELQHRESSGWLGPLRARPLDPALEGGITSGDPAVRRSVLQWRLQFGPPVASGTWRSLLRDPEPAVRRTALRTVLRDADRASFLPLLLEDPDPVVRLAALRAVAHDPERLRAHVLDRQANVRFMVRSWLQKAGVVLDYRSLALDALTGASGDRLGALGLLAETGVGADRALVARFLDDPVPRVRKEARRTLGFLDAYAG